MKQLTIKEIKEIKEIVKDEIGHLRHFKIIQITSKMEVIGQWGIEIIDDANIQIGFSRYSDNSYHFDGLYTSNECFITSTLYKRIISLIRKIESIKL